MVNLGLWSRVDSIVALPRYFRSIEVHQGSIVVRVNAIIELSQVTILSQRSIVIEWPLYFAIVAQQSIVVDKYKSGFMDLIMKFSRLVPLVVQVPFFVFNRIQTKSTRCVLLLLSQQQFWRSICIKVFKQAFLLSTVSANWEYPRRDIGRISAIKTTCSWTRPDL